jgi:hypothetical protein
MIDFYELGQRIGEALSYGETFTPIDFKAAKKKKSCNKGYPCKGSCISAKYNCLNPLKGQSKTFADWLKTNKDKLSKTQKSAAIKQGVNPKGESIQAKLQAKLREAKKDKAKPSKFVAAEPGNVGEFEASKLFADPKRFQYKILGAHTKSGSVGSLEGVGKWDKNLAGIVQAWRDPADGKAYVVNGHNRLAKAKELGVDSVTVRFIDAPDAKSARAIGALTNIAEGRGTAIDAAKFMRDSGLTAEDMRRKGVPMGDKVASDGAAMANLSDRLFFRAVTGEMPPERAALIGRSGLKPDAEQDALVSLLEKEEKKGRKMTNETVSELIDVVRSASHSSASGNERQMSLFDFGNVEKNLAVEKAEIQSDIRRRLSRDKKLFGVVGKSGNAEELTRAGNQIDRDSSRKISQEAEQALRVFDALKNTSGPVSKLVNSAAERIAAGESPAKVKGEIYKQLAEQMPSWAKGDFADAA